MNTEALFLFLILLLGLVLCSFLGGNCGIEGFGTQENQQGNIRQNIQAAIQQKFGGGSGNGAATPASTDYSTYNHFDKSNTELVNGATYVDEKNKNNTLEVKSASDGSQTLNIIINGESIELKSNQKEPFDTFTTTTESFTTTRTTYSGPNGTAEVIQGEYGRMVIRVTYKGQVYIFGPNNGYYNPDEISNTQYYGSTGYNVQRYNGAYGGQAAVATGPYGNSAFYAEGPNGNAVAGTNVNGYYGPTANTAFGPYGGSATQVNGPYGGSATAVTGPNGNSAFYAEGPNGGSITGTNVNGADYASSLPPGIPRNMIAPGEEDLYILKSQVVPPVCPVCPAPSFREREKPCPACPACARCPEPSFECKKVPNYNSINGNDLPIAVLNDFSTFGM
jgi:hypothetical protein